jgi:hypothetical protein
VASADSPLATCLSMMAPHRDHGAQAAENQTSTFQNLPVTGLAQLSKPLSQSRSEPRSTMICLLQATDLSLSTMMYNVARHDLWLFAVIWTINTTQGHPIELPYL